MNKIFLILATLITAGASIVAWQNKSEFAQIHASNEDLDARITKVRGETQAQAKPIDDAKVQLKSAEDGDHDATARLTGIKQQDKLLTQAITNHRDDLNAEKAKIKAKEELLRKHDLGSADELNKKLEEESDKKEELGAAIAVREEESIFLNVEVNDKRSILQGLQSDMAEYEAKAVARARRFQVGAVDRDMEFAVINTDPEGIELKDRFIVERDGQWVGVLVVKRVEQAQVIANILRDGGSRADVRAGDMAILHGQQEG